MTYKALQLPRWIYALYFIHCNSDCYIYQIFKHIETSYNHTNQIINMMVKEELITKQKKGRRVYLTLTEKGLKMGEAIHIILTSCNINGYRVTNLKFIPIKPTTP